MQLSRLILWVTNVNRLAAFYQTRLGMERLVAPEVMPHGTYRRRLILGYTGAIECPQASQAALELCEVRHLSGHDIPPYRHHPADVYWKIGITLQDVRRARRRLRAAGVAVSAPHQFRDIGFLCHLEDPEGFQIELLQQDFEAHHVPAPPDPSHPLGSPATLGQITLRVTDIAANLHFYRDALGMKLLSVQPVTPYGFTLYFLSWTSDEPPYPDVKAVDNRPWLWKRPYTTLELQHLWDRPPGELPLHRLPEHKPGFAGLGLSCSDLSEIGARLVAHHVPFELAPNGGSLRVYDPQGASIVISHEETEPIAALGSRERDGVRCEDTSR